MSDIYIGEGQTALEIIFICQRYVDGKVAAVDLTDATVIIKYSNSETEGFWPAEITGANQGVVRFEFEVGGGITPNGQWIVWPHVTFPDGRTAPGKPQTFVVKKEGTA